MPTKSEFLTKYEELLKDNFAWAKDEAKLRRFIDTAVKPSIEGGDNPVNWICEGSVVTRAFQDIGGRGKATLTAIRALQD